MKLFLCFLLSVVSASAVELTLSNCSPWSLQYSFEVTGIEVARYYLPRDSVMTVRATLVPGWSYSVNVANPENLYATASFTFHEGNDVAVGYGTYGREMGVSEAVADSEIRVTLSDHGATASSPIRYFLYGFTFIAVLECGGMMRRLLARATGNVTGEV